MSETTRPRQGMPGKFLLIRRTGWIVAGGLPFLPDPVAGAFAWITALFLLLSITLGFRLLHWIRTLAGGEWGSAFSAPPVGGRTFAGLAFGLAALLGLARWAQAPTLPVSPFHSWWFAWPLWLTRAAVLPALWCYLFYRAGPRSGEGGKPDRGAAVIALLVAVPTFWLAVVDWQMLFIPGWNSTLFPFYQLFGTLPSAVAMAGLLDLRAAPRTAKGPGRAAVFLTTLWAYLWFCQYLLVWYAGIPTEAHYWLVRTTRGWESLTFAVPLVGWLLPFLLLLPAATRRRRSLAFLAYSGILLGRWLDLYLVWQPERRVSPWPWILLDILPLAVVGAALFRQVPAARSG